MTRPRLHKKSKPKLKAETQPTLVVQEKFSRPPFIMDREVEELEEEQKNNVTTELEDIQNDIEELYKEQSLLLEKLRANRLKQTQLQHRVLSIETYKVLRGM